MKRYNSYISFNLPQLTSGDYVTNAELSLYNYYSRYSNPRISIYEVLSNWDVNTITYNNQPTVSSTSYDFNTNVSSFHKWNITRSVRDWYSGAKQNYGFELLSTLSPSTEPSEVEYYSVDFNSSYYSPLISIYYYNSIGLENYWTYHSQDVGRAGTGHVNDFTGNLVFVHNDLSMNGNRMPVDLNHIYNSSTHLWSTNFDQYVTQVSINGEQYYKYRDGDGTIHYFKYEASLGKYVDEDGLNLALTIENGILYIKDKQGNVLSFGYFPSTYYLDKITDSNGNSITMNRSYISGKYIISSITDGAGRIINYNYDSNVNLIGIADPAGRLTTFEYTNGKLMKIIYPDTKFSEYSYDSNSNLTSATNHEGYKIVYEYSGTATAPFVTRVQEMNTNGTQGQVLNIVRNGISSKIFP